MDCPAVPDKVRAKVHDGVDGVHTGQHSSVYPQRAHASVHHLVRSLFASLPDSGFVCLALQPSIAKNGYFNLEVSQLGQQLLKLKALINGIICRLYCDYNNTGSFYIPRVSPLDCLCQFVRNNETEAQF